MTPDIVAIAGLLALVLLWKFGQQPVCVRCGGRGAHRDDCPLNRP